MSRSVTIFMTDNNSSNLNTLNTNLVTKFKPLNTQLEAISNGP